ncbi:MAG: hypothetical protein U0903_00005 [Planctomycetales bacterium]
MRTFFSLAFVLSFCLALPGSASAQGLLWSLPQEEGTFVRYFGDYHQTVERPESNAGPLELTWQAELTIKSLGKEEAEYNGRKHTCRWLEFKLATGKQSATGIETGPYGSLLYKVLVPEDLIIGKVADDRKIPVIFVPVVKGYRKQGNKPPQPVNEKVLTFYPLLGLFTYYPELTEVSQEPETIALPQLGDVTARHLKGVDRLQSVTSRSVNEGEIWLSSKIPFGWAKYQAKVTREQKDRTAPNDAFKRHAELKVEMSAVEIGKDARSEIRNEDVTAAPNEEQPPTEKPAEEKPESETIKTGTDK